MKKQLYLSVCLLLSTIPNTAYSQASIVHDPTAAANAAEEILTSKELLRQAKQDYEALQEELGIVTEQLDAMNKMNNSLQSQLNTLGEHTNVVLPYITGEGIKNQLQSDLQCLLPTLPNFGLSGDEQSFSICDRSARYEEKLFANENSNGIDGTTIPEARENRDYITKNSIKNGLAASDKTNANEEEIADAITAAEYNNNADLSQQERLKSINDTLLLQAKITQEQNRLLAETLRIQSLILMHNSVPVSKHGETLSLITIDDQQTDDTPIIEGNNE